MSSRIQIERPLVPTTRSSFLTTFFPSSVSFQTTPIRGASVLQWYGVFTAG